MPRLLHAASFVLFLAAPATAAEPTARQLAERLDFVRRPNRSFEVRLEVSELHHGKLAQQGAVRVMARKHANDPSFDAVGLCLEPGADRGKTLLTSSREIWFFDPKSKHPTRVSPHHFKGKFFVAEALSSSFAADYDCELDGEETIQDAGKQEVPCLRLKMRRREKNSLIPELMEYWIDKKLLQPIRGQYFTSSGKLLHTSYYAGYAKVLGETRPTRVLVVSNTERGVVTDIKLSGFATREWPEEMFGKEALERVAHGELP